MINTAPQGRVWSSRLLITGGHQHICGGLETFISRARDCLAMDAHSYTDTPSGGPRGVLRYLAGLWRFSQKIKAYDIVWLHYGSAFDLAYLLVAKLSGKSVAVTPHLGRGWRSMRIGLLRALCNRTLMAADAVFTLYEAQPAELAFPRRITRRCTMMGTFLPKTLLEDDAARPNYAGPLRLIHVARLSKEKGSFAFLSVCDALRHRQIPFEATIAGPADDKVRQALQAQITEMGLTVNLVGALPQNALMAMLRTHDVLVNLSLQDAYPLTALEALLCGVAPVCCALPGTKEMAEDFPAISLVEGQNAQAAAEHILTLNRGAILESAERIRHKFGWLGLQNRYRTAFAQLSTASVEPHTVDAKRALPR